MKLCRRITVKKNVNKTFVTFNFHWKWTGKDRLLEYETNLNKFS